VVWRCLSSPGLYDQIASPFIGYARVSTTDQNLDLQKDALQGGIAAGYPCGGPGEPCDSENRPYFRPGNNISWGASFYQALPWPLQLLGIAIVAAAGFWACISPLSSAEGEESENSKLPAWTPWALAGGSMALFAILPVAYSEGDSNEFDRQILVGAIWRERALLDFYLKVLLWLLLRPIFTLPSTIFGIVAVFAGGVYMAGAALVGRTLGRNRSEAIFFIGALVAISNSIFFFRYVGTFATVTVLSLFVLWACWQYTQGRLSFGSVGAFATLAPFMHGSSLWWGESGTVLITSP
jgi:hypothetical protein